MNRVVKLINVVGARPQFIKVAAVSRAIQQRNSQSSLPAIVEKIIHTGQHYDENMSKDFFDELRISRPDCNLKVGSGLHGEQTAKMLQRIEAVLLKERPDICMVYGDTNSTLAGALAAAKLHIPVAHVEAGLRSFNRKMPEEINRVVTDHVSDLLFCPTKTAVENLAKEGVTQGVHETGDVMYDCVLFYAEKAKAIEEKTLGSLSMRSKSYYLATVHRADNTDDVLRCTHIVEALNEIATMGSPVILPLHPRTVVCIRKYGLKFAGDVKVVQPVSCLEMLVLENNARIILTDSGGVQKEAYCLRVPCITLRAETEWVETLESGWNTLAGADKHRIINGGPAGNFDILPAQLPCALIILIFIRRFRLAAKKPKRIFQLFNAFFQCIYALLLVLYRRMNLLFGYDYITLIQITIIATFKQFTKRIVCRPFTLQ